MKIKPEHYNYILNAIKPLAKHIQGHREALKQDKRVKDLEKRLRWDLFWAAKLSTWTSDNLYCYLNDNHIDTALKNIVAEIEVLN